MNDVRIRIPMAVAGAALAALTVLAAACGGGATSSTASPAARATTTPTLAASTAPAYPLTVKRSDGKTLTVAAPPKRIVSLSPGATEIIYAIGAEGSLVAVDKQANYPDAANAFPTKVDAYEPNVEAITALNPDLVIVASDTGGLVPKLDSLNIPVLYVDIDKDIRTIDAVLAQIIVLGQISGNDAAASALATTLAARIDKVKLALQGLSGVTLNVYHELDSTYYSASDDTFVGDLYRTLKVKNIAGSSATTYPQMTQEAIISANPQVIILADEAFGVSIDSVKARPGWNAIDAVRNSKIFAIDPDIISRPSPRVVDALEQLAKDVYPERFP